VHLDVDELGMYLQNAPASVANPPPEDEETSRGGGGGYSAVFAIMFWITMALEEGIGLILDTRLRIGSQGTLPIVLNL